MKVHNSVAKVMSIPRNETAEKKPELPKEPECRSTTSDEVSISGLVKNLRESLEADHISIGRSEKIARLKAEIGAGSYSVSGEAVAEKMLGIAKKM